MLPYISFFGLLRAVVPSAPTLTEKELPSQAGKVYIVTGSTSGVGQALAQILYSRDAKVYIAARSEEKATQAINSIKTNFPDSRGELVFLYLDLTDLTVVKKSAEEFLSKETRLHVLWNNASVMLPSHSPKTKQGYDLTRGTNNVGPFLFTKLLTPTLIKTAEVSPANSVRVVWVSSATAEFSPVGGVELDNLNFKNDRLAWIKYASSKAGTWYHCSEYARRYGSNGIVSVALNPGNLKTPLLRHVPVWQTMILNPLLNAPIYGAYTELFAGLSPDVTIDNGGCWIQPWGRIAPIRYDLAAGAKPVSAGGTGIGEKFWEWSEEQVRAYL